MSQGSGNVFATYMRLVFSHPDQKKSKYSYGLPMQSIFEKEEVCRAKFYDGTLDLYQNVKTQHISQSTRFLS